MTGQEFISFIKESFPLTPEQESRFLALDGLYRDWNSKINVISRKDIDNLYAHHVLHSLAIARYLQLEGILEVFARSTVLDLGTGGGFPGIPLAILFPSARFTLCDSVGKKTVVASAIADALGLGNVTVVNARAESLPSKFGYVVSRAVASLDNFYPWVRGKFTEGILYLKGGDIGKEISDLTRRCKVSPSRISVWTATPWLGPDEWFQGKHVVHVRA